MFTQGSDAGMPLIRQMAPGKRLGMTMEWPTAWSAAIADDGSPPAHRVDVPEEDCTTTVTPEVPEQAAACAGAAAAATPTTLSSAPTSPATPVRRVEPWVTGALLGDARAAPAHLR